MGPKPLEADDDGMTFSERVEFSRQWVTDRINNFSEDVDVFFVQSFFNTEVFDDDIDGSRGVISLDTRREIGGDYIYKLSAKLKLELPNTEKRLKLLISSEDDSEYEINKQPIQSIQNARSEERRVGKECRTR